MKQKSRSNKNQMTPHWKKQMDDIFFHLQLRAVEWVCLVKPFCPMKLSYLPILRLFEPVLFQAAQLGIHFFTDRLQLFLKGDGTDEDK